MKFRKERLYTITAVIGVSICIYLLITAARLPEYPHVRVLRYSFTISNPNAKPVEKADFWAYAPLPQTATQKRTSIRASYPYKLQKDPGGNERMYFLLGTMAPYATKVVSVDVEMASADTPNPVPAPRTKEYLRAQRFIESDTDEIRKLGAQLDAWQSASAAKNIYDWVSSNLVYAGYIANDMGARYAVLNKSGDCSEYAYLVTALSRAEDRSARVMAGFVVPGRNVLQPAEYHNWSEIYFAGTWHLVDAQRGNFDNHNADYIAFRVVNIKADYKSPDLGSQKLFGTDLPLSVRMNGRGF